MSLAVIQTSGKNHLAKGGVKNSQLIMIIIILFEVSTPALADGFSQEFEWQQVSLSLQDSSQYSDRSQ